MTIPIDKLVDVLVQLGAAEVDHTNGPLLTHLQGTYLLLQEWGCDEELCWAGLFHSIYGTDAFGQQSVAVSERDRIRRLIGRRAEELVYYFCAADREYFYERIGTTAEHHFRDRFAGTEVLLPEDDFRSLLHLTLANELEQVSVGNLEPRVRDWYVDLFRKMRPYVSPVAYQCFLSRFSIAE